MSARKVGVSLLLVAAVLAILTVLGFLLAIWTRDSRWVSTAWTFGASALVALIAATCPAWWSD